MVKLNKGMEYSLAVFWCMNSPEAPQSKNPFRATEQEGFTGYLLSNQLKKNLHQGTEHLKREQVAQGKKRNWMCPGTFHLLHLDIGV